ncbi:DUF4209 domain-containing protein [Enterobacter bugandensis]|uniref:DUF4209 domain-containing protein n=1 Tax=Enterobacter bugandensis TaxID=881260 RepID=UPI002FCFC714
MNHNLHDLMEYLDNSQEKISDHCIHSRIKEASDNDGSLDSVAERIAFGFIEDYADTASGWGTYFGPMMVWTDDGITYESPSIKLVTKEILDYWTARAKESNHPLLKARYYGLVWDFTKKVTNQKPDYSIATEYIKSLIDVINKDLCEHPSESIKKVTRAYKVACSINNNDLINACIDSAINLEDRIAEDDKAGLWGFCFDLFVLNKSKNLSQAQEFKLIEDLELRLARVSRNQSPWGTESAGIPLAKYYRTKGMEGETRRVIEVVGKSFEDSCEGLAPIQKSSILQHTHDIYLSYNMKIDAERVAMKITEVGPDVVDSMQEFSHATRIPKEKLEAYLESITSGGLESALNKIAYHFIPHKEQLEQQVLDLAKKHPLSYLFSKTLQDHKGRPVATIGKIEDDMEGNIIHQLSQNMSIHSFFLNHSFSRLSEDYNLDADSLTNFIFESPLFEESKRELIQTGLLSYLDKNYISAIHILTPQTEAAIRNLVELMGGATLKKNRQNGLQLRTFDDLLRDKIVEECMGTDTTFYFRVLLTDQRGWNLRNDVCHGISPSNMFNYSTADRIVHTLLCLSQVRESEK